MQRIPMIAIEKIQRELQDAPECPVEEVSKIRAVRLLAPQICAMQSKGYSLAAIAAMLSDKGLTVTAAALKSYLNVAKEAQATEGRKPPKRARNRIANRSDDGNRTIPRTGVQGTSVPQSPANAAEPSNPNHSVATATTPIPSVPTSASPKGSERPVPSRSSETPPRRSVFTPSKDSEDI
jgi:hypothetical protein